MFVLLTRIVVSLRELTLNLTPNRKNAIVRTLASIGRWKKIWLLPMVLLKQRNRDVLES